MSGYIAVLEPVRLLGEPFFGDRVFHFDALDILWHKERLINLAVERLPDEYDSVAWIDADILWPWHYDTLQADILDMLERWPIIQLWETALFLDAADLPMEWPSKKTTTQSMAAHNRWNVVKDADPRYSHPGFGWAARREVLQQIGGLFDSDPCGGEDTLHCTAWFGHFDTGYFIRHNSKMKEHTLKWVRKAYEVVAGKVGFLPQQIRHLYHGNLANRQYWDRVVWIQSHGFDPERHLIREPGQLYRWSEECPQEIVDWMAEYLVGRRREDDVIGRPNAAVLTGG